MAYTDIGFVSGLMARVVEQDPFDTSSMLTNLEVDVIIDAVAGEMDTAIASAGYVAPATTPDSFLSFLELVNAYGASALILRSLFPDSTGPAEQPAWSFFASWYSERLEGLRDGTAIPPGATPDSGSRPPAAETFLSLHPDEQPELGPHERPLIRRDQVF